MKNLYIMALGVAALMSACNCNKAYECKNNSTTDVTDKLFVISRNELSQYVKAGNDDFIKVTTTNGDILPSQTDDIDGDGSWDELAFLADVKAGSTVKVTFEAGEVLGFVTRTNLRFGSAKEPNEELTGVKRLKSTDSPSISAVFQMEGPAWENDKVGFRNYYDARNGIDIFGKSTTAMALDNAGIRGQNYHERSDWGMDVLKVANSLGAGAIAIGIADSVYRVGVCETGECNFVAEGPVRSILELTFKGVPAGDRLYDVKHRITIAAGDLCYKSQVWIDNLQGDEMLVTGIVDKHDLPSVTFEEGDFSGFYTHGKQAYTNEILGMAIAAKKNSVISFTQAPKTGDGVTETYFMNLKISKDTPAEYYFFSGWEYQDSTFVDAKNFEEAVKQNLRKF
jgi:hypothetical protein